MKFTDCYKPRHQTCAVSVGGVLVGGGSPIVVQSMTNTHTADVAATTHQIMQLANTGSELVRKQLMMPVPQKLWRVTEMN